MDIKNYSAEEAKGKPIENKKAARREGLTAKIMGFFGVSIEGGLTIMNRLRKFNTDKSCV